MSPDDIAVCEVSLLDGPVLDILVLFFGVQLIHHVRRECS
jgi:hypothetical protein